ncbi:MAG: antitoxin PrlF [Aliidongia sp.]|jgi:AbrB family looped-hinge helix DNA binding protein|nr:antitoxin PrlF [Aliidongia sp.]
MQANLTIASNGRVVIPANMRAQMGLSEGGKVVARIENGAVILESIEAAIQRAQSMVRRYVPVGTPLVAELIDERHKAAERE